MNQETLGLRVHEALKAPQAHQENQAAGDVLAAMVPGECQGRQDQRVTEVLMGWLVCLVRRGTGVIQAHQVHQEHPETTGRGVMMEKLDLEVYLENLDPEVCWDQKGHRVPQDHRV